MLEATGTVTALNSVDIRPQIASTITKVQIKEGQFVSAGQPLFTLDARNDEVNVTKARAQLAKDQAALADAERQLARSKDLFAQNFISQGAVDTNQTLVDSAARRRRRRPRGDRVGAGRPVVQPDRRAGEPGRAGAINVFAGSLVQPCRRPAGDDHPARPDRGRLQPAAAQPRRCAGDAARRRRQGDRAPARQRRRRCPASSASSTTPSTRRPGTVRVKAEFANKDERLWPGAFVTVRLAVQTLKGASVIPQAAIIQSPRGKIVYVVDAGAKAAARPVEIALCERRRGRRDRRASRASGSSSTGARTCAPARRWSSAPPATPAAAGAAARPRGRERRLGVGGDERGRRGGRDGDRADAGRLARASSPGSRP